MLLRFAYALLWTLALPLALARLCWRARRQPAYAAHVGERFGRYAPHPGGPTLWVHAVSVGETRAAEPLIRAMRTRWPAHRIVLTAMTPTGRDTAHALFGTDPAITLAYLPYDHPLLVGRFLQHFSPAFGVVMETELWPALLHACAASGRPVMLANARLSERSARGYARWPALTHATLGALAAIGCQTDDDGRRLAALGASSVTTTGNIKFDISPPSAQLALAQTFRARLGGRPAVLLASARDGEEAMLLDALPPTAQQRGIVWVIVPRHPQRFDDVARLVAARGLRLRRRSENEAVGEADVWLGDSMGEMFAYYAACDVALIGGSWLPLGGQNLIEPCAVGTPVLVGPHTFNFAQVAEQAVETGAALRAADLPHAVALATALLDDPPRREAMSVRGRDFARRHAGATARTMAVLDAMVAAQGC